LAQYVWLDENGRKQFSDQAPPASVPKSRILKFAGKSTDDKGLTSTTSSSMPSATPNSDEKTKQSDNLADKDLAYKKRHDELVAKEKKEQEDAKVAATKSENCRRMKEYKKTLEIGQRVSQTDVNGTVSFMTDEKRAQELNEVQHNLTECGN
jgi:hypothetical protein